MSQTSIVVVGLDDSEPSRRAVEWAAREAVRRDATLQVITAWTWEGLAGAPLAAVDPEVMQKVAQDTQDRVLSEVMADLPVVPVVAREVVRSTAAEALVEASRHADFVVLGTHARGPLRTMLLGSVSQAVIRHAACPVIVLPPVHETASVHEELVTRVGVEG
jgi:nucleotide-binding universal stress UspA family protein